LGSGAVAKCDALLDDTRAVASAATRFRVADCTQVEQETGSPLRWAALPKLPTGVSGGLSTRVSMGPDMLVDILPDTRVGTLRKVSARMTATWPLPKVGAGRPSPRVRAFRSLPRNDSRKGSESASREVAERLGRRGQVTYLEIFRRSGLLVSSPLSNSW